MGAKWAAILILTFVLSFCSFGFQTLIAFAVYAITGGKLLPWLTVLACFLLGLGGGSLRAGKIGAEELRARLVPTELLIALIGGLSALMLFGLDALLKITPVGTGYHPAYDYIIVGFASLLAGAVGYFSGYELPIILSAFDAKILGQRSHWVIGSHYFGTLVASLVVQIVMIPRFDVIASTQLLGMVNCFVGVVTIVALNLNRRRLAYGLAGMLCCLLLLLALRGTRDFYGVYLKVNYFRPTLNTFNLDQIRNIKEIIRRSPVIERTRSLIQYLDIMNVPSRRYEGKIDTLLYLDTHLQFGSSDEKIYHELMTHLPIAAFGKIPKRVMIAGGGDGLLARELLRYPEIQRIDLVELDPMMLDFANFDSRFTSLNQKSLQDPRVNVINGDAFAYLRRRHHAGAEKYDVILIDFPFPHNPDLARLYSREFYRVVRHNLADGGHIVLDYPLELSKFEAGGRNDIIFNTLKAAGFTDFLPFVGYDSYVAARLEKGDLNEIQSPFISQLTKDNMKVRLDLLTSVQWNDAYINSIFRPLSFGKGFE